MNDQKRFSTTQAARAAGISRDTLLRWLTAKKIPEPDRNRNGWRVFTESEVNAIIRFAHKITPAPRKQQTRLRLRGA
jgi:site-specific DNA-methyltransferase (cytosine-N4-specific)